MMKTLPLAVLVVTCCLSACSGGSSPTAPSSTATTPSPAPAPAPAPPAPPPVALVTVAGVVTNTDTARAVSGATVSVASRSATTDGNGYYSISGVPAGTATMTVSASGYNTSSEGVTVQSSDTRIDRRLAPLWSRSGNGNTVFDLPTFVSRIRIQGTWGQRDTSNFIVYISGRVVVNEILRTSITYDGTHVVPAGTRVVEIQNSSAITWTMSQVQ